MKHLEAARGADSDWGLPEGESDVVLVVGAEPAFLNTVRIALDGRGYGATVANGEGSHPLKREGFENLP